MSVLATGFLKLWNIKLRNAVDDHNRYPAFFEPRKIFPILIILVV